MKTADVMTPAPRFLRVSPILVLFFGLVFTGGMSSGQTVRTWDGNGNSNAGGVWSGAANWSSDDVPDTAAEYATLPDVTAGTRAVTVDGATTLGRLAMDQSTTEATNRLVLGADLHLTTSRPLGLTPPADKSALQLDLNGKTLTTYNRHYQIALDGTVIMGAGSVFDFGLDNNQGGMDILNDGIWVQSASRANYHYDVASGNNASGSSFTRNYLNTGTWIMTNGAAFMLSGPYSTPGGFGLLSNCRNSGSMQVLEGSTNTFAKLTNTGSLALGVNSLLGYGNATLFNAAGGVFNVTGTNAMLGIPLSMSPSSGTAVLDNEGTVVLGSGADPSTLTVRNVSFAIFTNRLGGVVAMKPGSSLVLQYLSAGGSGPWYNSGVVTQDNASVVMDWAASVNGSATTRNFYNYGTWTLKNGAVYTHLSTTGRPATWALNDCRNTGTLNVLSGSHVAFRNLANSGSIQLGDNAMIAESPNIGGSAKTLLNTGVISVAGTNAIYGYVVSSASAYSTLLTNGTSTSTGARIIVGDGVNAASLDIRGSGEAQLANFSGNTVTVSRAASLGLICNASGSTQTSHARLINRGTFVHEGKVQLRPNWNGDCFIRNMGEYQIGTGTVVTGRVEQLPGFGSGVNIFSNASFYNDAPGTLSGCGLLVFTNKTGSASRNTLTLTSSGTLAPGAPTGTLELVNTAATLNNGTLAVRVLNESTSSQLKISGLGAAFSLGGASDTLDVIPVDGTPWAGLAVFRIYEGGPLTGTFDTLLWNGEPASGEYSVTYGTTFIDIAVNGSRTTVIVIK